MSTVDDLAGRYPITPNFVLTVTHEGEHLFVQATGQPKFEVFPESRDRSFYFFYKVVDAQLDFVRGADGAVPSPLVLHQGGRDLPAPRQP
jgi:serine-type D-Ala-D-Ala carboxypeptidase/endopeptidase